jgi:hypothetical protein
VPLRTTPLALAGVVPEVELAALDLREVGEIDADPSRQVMEGQGLRLPQFRTRSPKVIWKVALLEPAGFGPPDLHLDHSLIRLTKPEPLREAVE